MTTLIDYSDDEDFYTQGFEKTGMVSVWLGMTEPRGRPVADTLRDLCGVGHYRLSDQESNCFDFQEADVCRLLAELSYSASFADHALAAAHARGIAKARWVTVQYDFAYSPAGVRRPIADDPVFIGAFPYSAN